MGGPHRAPPELPKPRSVSMVEPGPVNTDFELKLMEEVARSEFPGADEATVHYFKDVYLPASHEIFTTLGQSPAAVAEVRGERGWGRGGTGFRAMPLGRPPPPPPPSRGSGGSVRPQAMANVIGARRPAFRTQTNGLYTPLVALKYADPTGDLSVGTYYRLLFHYGTLFHLSMAVLRCLTCGCFRRRIAPL